MDEIEAMGAAIHQRIMADRASTRGRDAAAVYGSRPSELLDALAAAREEGRREVLDVVRARRAGYQEMLASALGSAHALARERDVALERARMLEEQNARLWALFNAAPVQHREQETAE